MYIRRVLATTLICFLIGTDPVSFTLAGDWPQWRGPTGNGVGDEEHVPLTWSKTENVKWRVALPGPGNSSPIVVGEQVFLTCANQSGQERNLISFDRNTGEVLWSRSVEFDSDEATHKTNPQCSPSPVSDGERVVAWFGSAGLFCYDLNGQEIWSKDLGTFEHIWGTGTSPVIFDDKVILSAGPGLRAFVIAVDKRTGEEVWRRDIKDSVSEEIGQFRGSWSTPVFHKVGERDLMFLSLPLRLHVIDPQSGQDVWTCDGGSELVYTSPLVNDEIAVVMCGFHGPAFAVRHGGMGDVTETHRIWLTQEKNPQRIGTGMIVGEHIFINNEDGLIWCMELTSGEVLWRERLSAKSWSSMTWIADRIYVSDQKGTTYVIAPNPEGLEVLARNELGEPTNSSLAFSEGQVFARTSEFLYCVE